MLKKNSKNLIFCLLNESKKKIENDNVNIKYKYFFSRVVMYS